jgi:hypothetical protein
MNQLAIMGHSRTGRLMSSNRGINRLHFVRIANIARKSSKSMDYRNKTHCPMTHSLLVGLKCDLRDSFAQNEEEFQLKGMNPVESSKGTK